MNLLIKGISISLLSLVGVDAANARPGFGGELGPVRYGSNYPAGPSLAAHHGGDHYEGSPGWSTQVEGGDSHQKERDDEASAARSDDSRLSPEQRRALRHEIKKVGRELYRPK